MTLLNVMQAYPALYLCAVAILGFIVGSFLNVVIYRLPVILQRQWKKDCHSFLSEQGNISTETSLQENETRIEKPFNLITPRSRCPHCEHNITAIENIPILSYLFLKGRCTECKAPISLRYPFIEGLSAILVLTVAWHFGLTWQTGATMLLTWALIALTFIDFDHQYLPDNITLPFLWLGLLLNINNMYTDIQSAVIGAVAGYLTLWSVYVIFKRLTGKEGMGYGDFKLLAMLGAWLGWQFLPAIVLISSLVGSIVGITLIVFRKHERNIPIPFGPYLATAGWITLLWGNDINQAYLHWVGIL